MHLSQPHVVLWGWSLLVLYLEAGPQVRTVTQAWTEYFMPWEHDWCMTNQANQSPEILTETLRRACCFSSGTKSMQD